MNTTVTYKHYTKGNSSSKTLNRCEDAGGLPIGSHEDAGADWRSVVNTNVSV